MATPPEEATSAGVTVSVHITVQVGDVKKDFDVLATTDASGFAVAEGILKGLRDDASNWIDDCRRSL